MRVFLETAVDAIIVIDSRGLIESFNPSAEKMFGYRDVDVVGLNVNTLMPPPYAAQHDGYLESFLRTRQKKIIGLGREVEARRKDGTTFPIHLSVAELELNGEIRFTGIIRDLTKERKLQNELLHSQKLEAIGQLAGALAHDFNNLLMGVMSGCRVVARRVADDDESKSMLDEIHREAHQGVGITRQLLDFSRKSTYQTEPCDLAAIVRNAESLFRNVLGEDVELRVSAESRGCTVLADHSKVDQILMNLVVNARDAMPTGGRIDIGVTEVEVASDVGNLEPGPHVLISVSDNGCGMDEVTRSKVFEPFFTTKPIGKGTGLGLSTVFGLTKEFGGHVELESAVGKGTTFILYFPRCEDQEEAHGDDAPSEIEGGTETILVVEDVTLVRAGIRYLLKSLGYTVLDAPDPKAALELVADAPKVDLLLTDIVMPGMSGPELAKVVQSKRPDIRVLFMSAFSDETLVEQGRLESGMPVLEKPFEEEELARKVRAQLSNR